MVLSPSMEIHRLLSSTTVPVEAAERLLRSAPALWLASAPPAVLAGDVVLAHPHLQPGEIRAVARPLSADRQRLTVVAEDRRGLLADTAAAVTAAGWSVESASAATWMGERLALHSLTIEGSDNAAQGWDELGRRLRQVAAGARPVVGFEPRGRADVSVHAMAERESVLTVEAPDQPGLLAAICAWLDHVGVTIEAMQAVSDHDSVHDVFLVEGAPDARALARHLSASAALPSVAGVAGLATLPARLAIHAGRAAWRTAFASPEPMPSDRQT